MIRSLTTCSASMPSRRANSATILATHAGTSGESLTLNSFAHGRRCTPVLPGLYGQEYPPVTELRGSWGGVIEELGGRDVQQHGQRHQDAPAARLTSRLARVRTGARRAAAGPLTPAVLWRDRLARVVQTGQDGAVQHAVADHDVLTVHLEAIPVGVGHLAAGLAHDQRARGHVPGVERGAAHAIDAPAGDVAELERG